MLDNPELNFKDRFTNFREFIRDNHTVLTTPHSTIPKDLMKGILVLVAAAFLIIPGVLLGICFLAQIEKLQRKSK